MDGFAYTPYIFPALGSAVICLILARFAWVRRPSLGTTTFALLTVTISFWSLAYALEIGAVSLADKVMWAKVQYAAIVSVPLFWVALAFDYRGRERFLNRRNLLLLSIFPLITFTLVLTNEGHQLVWANVSLDETPPFTSLVVKYGFWFWFHVLYSYTLIFIGSVSFLSFIRRSILPLYRWQALVLLTGVLAPWVANGIYIVGNSPHPEAGFNAAGLYDQRPDHWDWLLALSAL